MLQDVKLEAEESAQTYEEQLAELKDSLDRKEYLV